MLDNCEHLLDSVRAAGGCSAEQAPRLKSLPPAEKPWASPANTPIRVPSLAIPDPRQLPDLADLQEYEAVRLFTERARAVLPTFAVDERNAPAIARICQRLDGIPLALELAAARSQPAQPGTACRPAQLCLPSAHRGQPHRSAQAANVTRQPSIGAMSCSHRPNRFCCAAWQFFPVEARWKGLKPLCSGEGLEAEQILDLLGGLVNKSMVNAELKQPEETRYRLLGDGSAVRPRETL